MYAEAVDDEKLRLLAYEDRWHFVAILCLKSQGTLDAVDGTLSRRIAVKMGLRVTELDEVKRRLLDVGLIDDNFQPIAWERRQYASDSPSYKAEKQRRYRTKHKALRNGGVTVTTPLPPRTDTDTETDKEKPTRLRAKGSYPDEFETWWSMYPAHRKPSKSEAFKQWKAQHVNGHGSELVAKLQQQIEAGVWDEGHKYCPNAQKYLKERRWEVDITAAVPDWRMEVI